MRVFLRERGEIRGVAASIARAVPEYHIQLRPMRLQTIIVLAVLVWTAHRAAAQTSRGVSVSGVVQDQTGAVLPGATVQLQPAGATPAEPPPVVTDSAGAFRFAHVAAGSYDLHVGFPGFAPSVTHLRVAARSPAPMTIVLQIEGVTQEVSVSGGGNQTGTTGSANLDAVSVDAAALDDLPVLDQDVVSSLSRFLDSSAIGTAGATLVVDGVEVNALAVSASAVQQIKINQDPYAAEFMRPGRGRIEIVTKPGGRDYTGTFNVRFRDSSLYAKNAFAATKPPQQRRIFEGTLGGPVRGFEKTNFMASASHDAEDSQAVVFANTLAGTVQANVPTPSRRVLAAITVNRQQGEHNTLSLRFSHQRRSEDNQGVGGVTLAEAGRSGSEREDDTTYTQQTVLSNTLLHEVRFMAGVENEPYASASAAPKIVVNDAFVGGGAQADSLRTEHHFTLTDAMTWSPANHVLKFGVNIPDWSRRRFDDHTNTGGTFSFATLDDYAAGRPYAYTRQVGNGHVVFIEKVIGLFAQDEVRVRPNLTVDLGVRYDWQNFFHDTNNFAPRFSAAWAPGEGGRTVIRAGGGVFYDRTGPGPIQDLIRYDGVRLLKYVLVDPGYPDPLLPGQTLSAQPPGIVQLAPDITIPFTVHYSVGVERQLAAGTTLALTFIGARGHDLFRSRDINAPAPPLFLDRPDPTKGVVRQIESAGTLRTSTVQATFRGHLTRRFNGMLQYSFGHVSNDTSGINWMPPNSYDLSQEYGPADYERRHVVELFGSWNAGRWGTAGGSFEAYSGRPYSITTGLDPFNTGSANARPDGVPRNSARGPGFASLDLRWSHDLLAGAAKGRRSLVAGIDVFNALDRVNASYYVGNLSSSFFGQAIAASSPRRVQFSLRAKF
ncbi:MAG TPA: TonB-dependent receptor [Vicinamibacterales bacterium]|nr:TonB-dependent receptor [Vicinamibacterales bacterium]